MEHHTHTKRGSIDISNIELRQQNGIRASTAADTLLDAIAYMSDGLVVYDDEDHVILCNTPFRRLYGFSEVDVAPGIHFKHLVRLVVERGTVMQTPANRGDYFHQQCAHTHHANGAPFTVRLRDGRWLNICERQTAGGRIVGIHHDITGIRRAEEQLALERSKLTAILENIDQGIVLYDREWRVSAYNQRWADILGLSREFLAMQPTLEEIIRDEVERGIDYNLPGDTEEKVRAWIEPVLAADGPYMSEQRLADGTVIELWTNPLPSGRLVRTLTDVTARRQVEQALRESEQRYVLATHAAAEAIYEWDVEEDTIHRAQSFMDKVEFAVDTPQEWTESIHPDDFSAYRDAIVAHFKGRTDHVECEYRVRRKPRDSYSWVLDRGVAVRDGSGRAVRYVGAVSDITARKQTEIALREAKEQVAQQFAVIREVFGKYVPESVATAIVAGHGTLEPTQTTATILYSDIEAFTSITENMAPAHVVQMLNEYFPAVIEPITRYGGIINQFQGDAMLVTFNVLLADPRHADNAVKAALDIQKIVRNVKFAGVQLPTRIGINTGEVIAGNVGSGDRINYTVHGNAVNVAARLEQLNKDYGTYVLIAESTVAALSDAYSIESIGEVKIRGNNAPAQIFKLAA